MKDAQTPHDYFKKGPTSHMLMRLKQHWSHPEIELHVWMLQGREPAELKTSSHVVGGCVAICKRRGGGGGCAIQTLKVNSNVK